MERVSIVGVDAASAVLSFTPNIHCGMSYRFLNGSPGRRQRKVETPLRVIDGTTRTSHPYQTWTR